MCIHLLTQKASSRKENRALNDIESGKVDKLDVIHQMSKNLLKENPGLDASLANIMASASLMYAKQVKDGSTPIADAVKSSPRKKVVKASVPSPSPEGSPIPV